MNLKKKLLMVLSLLIISVASLFSEGGEVSCSLYAGWLSSGDPVCWIECTDGTTYPVSCNSDIMQDNKESIKNGGTVN